jgi:aryl-alcohol dehydrogenase-like predicted oxidoreductase
VVSLGGPFERGKAATLHALELGVNYIDTAPTYGNSEESLGQILSYAEQPVILSTKLGGRPCPFDPKNKTHLRKSFEMSLKSLRREQIDILM